MQVGWSILLIIHGILAVFLLGAVTHQAVGAVWPVTKRTSGFVGAVRSVNGMNYTNAIIILFIVTFALGTIIYPTYRSACGRCCRNTVTSSPRGCSK
jgi:hypothetical protein